MHTCPFAEENLLSDIAEAATPENTKDKVSAFKTILDPAQSAVFVDIDDTLANIATTIQRDTIIKIHCPTCPIRTGACE